MSGDERATCGLFEPLNREDGVHAHENVESSFVQFHKAVPNDEPGKLERNAGIVVRSLTLLGKGLFEVLSRRLDVAERVMTLGRL